MKIHTKILGSICFCLFLAVSIPLVTTGQARLNPEEYSRLSDSDKEAYLLSVAGDSTVTTDSSSSSELGNSLNNPDNFNNDDFSGFDDSFDFGDLNGDGFGLTPEQGNALIDDISTQTLQRQDDLGRNIPIENYNQLPVATQWNLSQVYNINQADFNAASQTQRNQIIQQYVQNQAVSAAATQGDNTGPGGPTTQPVSFTGNRGADEIKFQPLDGPGTGIAGFTDVATATSLAGILNAGYQILIGIASVLAVVMIFYAGFRYATTVSPGAKTDAKNRILAALGGLLLALSSWLILSTIDDDLVGVEFNFEGFEEGTLTFDLRTADGREALNREHQGALVVQQGSPITPQGSTGSTGSIGGVATGATVLFPSGARFPTVTGTSFGGIDYTDGGGGRFARGVGLIDTQGRENVLLSRNFKVRDFKTRDGARYARISPRVVQGLQNIRDRAGIALTLTSAYRHPAYNNSKTGSGTNGAHTAGHAIDIGKPSGMSYEELARLVIDEFGCNIGLGMGGGMVHFDFRGQHQSWAYTGYTNGQVNSFYDSYCEGK